MKKVQANGTDVIVDVKGKGNGIIILLDSISYTISKEDYLDGYYYPGKTLSKEEITKLVFLEKNKKAKDYLTRLLSSSRYTKYQLEEKLKMKFYLKNEEIETLLSPYLESHVIDDLEYAKDYIASKTEQGYGQNYIVQNLKQKGISSDILKNKEIRSLLEHDKDMILEVSKKYIRQKKNDTIQKKKSSLQDFLARRGYQRADISHAMEALFSSLSEAEIESDKENQAKELKQRAGKCYNSINRKKISEKDKRNLMIQRLLSYGYHYQDILDLLSQERYYAND